MTSTYRGYEVHRNRLTGKFYAIPIADTDLTRKIVCNTATELRAAIDAATQLDDRRLDPWNLPSATATPQASARKDRPKVQEVRAA